MVRSKGFTLITMRGKVRKTNQSATRNAFLRSLKEIMVIFRVIFVIENMHFVSKFKKQGKGKKTSDFLFTLSFSLPLHLFYGRFTQQSGRPEDQNQDQQGKGKNIFIITGYITGGKGFG